MSHTNKALWFLWRKSAANKLKKQALRLKEPRYLIALIIGILYLMWVFSVGPGGSNNDYKELAKWMNSESIATIVSAFLLFMTARWWLAKPDRTALAFNQADVHLLFPAPVSRRQLVHFKLLRGQSTILLTVLLWVVIMRGGSTSIESWQRAISLWILFSTFTLHRLAAALVRSNAIQNRRAGWRAALIPSTILATVISTVAIVLWQSRTAIREAWLAGIPEFLSTTTNALQHPAAAVALAPTKALAGPIIAVGSSSWLSSLIPAAIVFLLHYAWVLKTDAAFEEAALEASRERAKLVTAIAAGRLPVHAKKQNKAASWLPPIPAFGHPSVAIAWKNLAAAIRSGAWLKQILFLSFGMLALLFILDFAAGLPTEVVVFVSAMWTAMFLLIGPLSTRYDLRMDLRDMALIRTFPLAGRSIVISSILMVSLLHTVNILFFLAAPIAFLLINGETSFLTSLESPVLYLISIFIGIVLVNLMSFTVQNGLAVMFPAWVNLGSNKSSGFEAMGQTMLTVGITVLVVAILLVFPGIIGISTYFLVASVTNDWALLAGLISLGIILLVELFPVWFALGGVLDKTEPADVPGQVS